MNPIIKLDHVYKRYTSGDTEILVLKNINYQIEKGEFVIILGASGAGKTTVLYLFALYQAKEERNTVSIYQGGAVT
ncbi:ATP-binding cassette domain-containing protein [Gracilibacillus alcaliphilus]|uniref:ATP-binding cassette domain-containing protein n=1 Tax=Gracilibacillus alcaliphilus TaxID=1401441 RepID=UPI001958067F|nr:ATP-binding cassette domain-containing protein [Gracilibacillus alcaliphilus]MBM7676170.1 ABC-type lipoprotein export system ATPase subunit [Gracilibacillus alcaliphilus]